MRRCYLNQLKIEGLSTIHVMKNSLDERKKQILFAIINDYITTASPVGSKTISKRYSIELSSATIRAVMADLEEMGLLYHPHTSAGRIPTKSGFKYYVDTMLQVKNLSDKEKEAIKKRCLEDYRHVGDIMKQTSKILSNISSYAGLVLAPKKTKTIFKHIHFIKLRARRVLAVLVSKKGIVQNKIIELEDDIAQSELDKIHNYLNSELEGLSLEKVREKIIEEMKAEKSRYDKVLSRALKLGQKTFAQAGEDSEVFVEGEMNLIDHPEFADTAKLKSILRTLEHKTLLMEILEKTLEADGIQIFIGAEVIHPDLKDLSLITSRYIGENDVLGTLGIIGPTRMNYPKIIPLVDYTAKFISKLLAED